MLRQEIKELKTGPRDLRKFGLMVGGVLSLLGLWFLYRHKAHYSYLLYPGLLLLVMGGTIPRGLKYPYIGWMALAFCLGLVVSTILLTVFFYVVLTPVGLAARLVGRDFLDRRRSASARSYWLPRDYSRPKPPAEYERQF